jgi:ankyrin repeat protein
MKNGSLFLILFSINIFVHPADDGSFEERKSFEPQKQSQHEAAVDGEAVPRAVPQLPNFPLLYIGSFLDYKTLTTLRCSSKRYKDIADQSLIFHYSKLSPEKRNEKLLNAAKTGKLTTIQLLMKAKCCDIETRDKDGNTPLILACKKGHYDVVEKLLDSGASIEAQNKLYNIILMQDDIEDFGMQGIVDQSQSGNFGQTALMSACHKGQVDIINLLLSRGASIDKCDFFGKTALMEAVAHGHENVVQLLIDQGADINRLDRWYENALSFASGQESITRLLLSRGAIEAAPRGLFAFQQEFDF